ncbi:hypothetical protein B0H12DRAFT_1245531 [Mycena haematopus]|nr:hypothetical protein B0H12DRAFT_1245531 [Mycena haematopus]
MVFGKESLTLDDIATPDVRFTAVRMDSRNIAYNDILLDQLRTNTAPLRQRNWTRWDRVLIKPGPKLQNVPRNVVHEIQTSIQIPKGKCPVPNDEKGAKKYVERERHLAEHGRRVRTVPDLCREASTFFLNEIHSNLEEEPHSYARFDSADLQGATLSIQGVSNNKDIDTDVVLLLTDMREALGDEAVDALPDLINAALGDGLLHQDSTAEGFCIDAIHLEPAYNRYAEQAHRSMKPTCTSFGVKVFIKLTTHNVDLGFLRTSSKIP